MVDTTPQTNTPHRPLVQIDGLCINFGTLRVLRDVSLSVPRGQTVAIIGETGCGKTVFLKTIIGLLRPTRGRVLLDGVEIAKLNEKELTKERVRFGFLFQQAALFDSMTVAQNVAFPLRQHTERPRSEVRRIVIDRLADVGLSEDVLGKRPAELSGGMRKRVGLARALALEPEIMLYDEPTTGLDPIMGDVINELIISTRQSHQVTSIVVTHDMRTARKVADRVVMLFPLSRLGEDQPQVIHDGPADQIEHAADPRVSQFVRGEAGERLMEMRQDNGD